MKKIIVALFVLFMTASVCCAMTYKEALTMPKPIAVLFHMQGCSACRQAKPIFEKMSSKYSDKFNFVKDDVNASSASDSFGVDSVPAMFIVDTKTNKHVKIPYECLLNEPCLDKKLSEYK